MIDVREHDFFYLKEKKYFKTSIEAVSELFEAAKNIDPSLK